MYQHIYYGVSYLSMDTFLFILNFGPFQNGNVKGLTEIRDTLPCGWFVAPFSCLNDLRVEIWLQYTTFLRWVVLRVRNKSESRKIIWEHWYLASTLSDWFSRPGMDLWLLKCWSVEHSGVITFLLSVLNLTMDSISFYIYCLRISYTSFVFTIISTLPSPTPPMSLHSLSNLWPLLYYCYTHTQTYMHVCAYT